MDIFCKRIQVLKTWSSMSKRKVTCLVPVRAYVTVWTTKNKNGTYRLKTGVPSPEGTRKLLSCTKKRPSVRPTQPHVQWVVESESRAAGMRR
jgi:hypothetical protein